MTSIVTEQKPVTRRDLHQHVTDTIIQQLEQGTVPWHKPWKGNDNRIFDIPHNFNTGKTYRGINILLLWSSALNKEFTSPEWSTLLQWNQKKEAIRKGEKGTMIVYYDTFEKEVDGEIKKIPFLKSSVVFNRCQLASFDPTQKPEVTSTVSLVERIEKVDRFIDNTKVTIEHKHSLPCYAPMVDKIYMPYPETFIDTKTCTATEGYYSTILHELVHSTGHKERLNRLESKKFGDTKYATEELVAELGAAFLCAGFDITTKEKGDHAAYIAHWLKVLKDDKHCIFSAASEASKAVDYLEALQPKMN